MRQKLSERQPKIVFVYGTLKEGEALHGWMEDIRAVRVPGYFRTLVEFPLVVSGLPYLLPRPAHGQHVKGEVYEISRNARDILDQIEGHPVAYRRSPIWVRKLGGGEEDVLAQAYFYQYFGELPKKTISWFTNTNQPEPM